MRGFPGASVVKTACNVGDTGLISVLGGSHMPWSNKAPGPPLLSRCPRALEPRLLSPHSQEPRPARREAATTRSLCAETTEWLLPITSRESPHSNKDPAQPKVKLLKKFFVIFDSLPKYQILAKLLLILSLFGVLQRAPVEPQRKILD